MKKFKICEIIFILFIFSKSSFAIEISSKFNSEIKRLVSTHLDLSKPYKIYLTYDLVSSIKFPYPITEAKVGNPDSVKVLISKTLGSELTLKLNSHILTPTNLIVRCGKKVFVIDLIPSKSIHQDYVKITGSYSDPEYENNSLTLVSSSLSTIKQQPQGILIDSSERHLQ